MGTIINQDGFRVMIYTSDHEPPHVYKSGTTVKIEIQTLRAFTFDMKGKDLKKAIQLVNSNQMLLMEVLKEKL